MFYSVHDTFLCIYVYISWFTLHSAQPYPQILVYHTHRTYFRVVSMLFTGLNPQLCGHALPRRTGVFTVASARQMGRLQQANDPECYSNFGLHGRRVTVVFVVLLDEPQLTFGPRLCHINSTHNSSLVKAAVALHVSL